ncbi:unnamed protein product, partial [Vitis vinifera]|uniref:Uncharacterized protein n=1 Tax=Vitis vinifera TaxID=29760 RepID=D7U5R0_VITVI
MTKIPPYARSSWNRVIKRKNLKNWILSIQILGRRILKKTDFIFHMQNKEEVFVCWTFYFEEMHRLTFVVEKCLLMMFPLFKNFEQIIFVRKHF